MVDAPGQPIMRPDSSILTTIMTTCKRLGVDPFEYVRDVFERISKHPQNNLKDLPPDNWKATQPAVTH